MKTIILISALIAIASARPASDEPQFDNVVKESYELSPDGTYSHEFETDGGLRQFSGNLDGSSVVGGYKYTAPDGTVVELTYVADENGYQPVGAHIPTPPPTPDYILRALEYIKEHPYKEGSTVIPIVLSSSKQ